MKTFTDSLENMRGTYHVKEIVKQFASLFSREKIHSSSIVAKSFESMKSINMADICGQIDKALVKGLVVVDRIGMAKTNDTLFDNEALGLSKRLPRKSP